MEILEIQCWNVRSWYENIHRITKEYVKSINQSEVEVFYENKKYCLGINRSNGFILYNVPNREIVWQKSLELLSRIDDDNKANLTIEFKDNTKVSYLDEGSYYLV